MQFSKQFSKQQSNCVKFEEQRNEKVIFNSLKIYNNNGTYTGISGGGNELGTLKGAAGGGRVGPDGSGRFGGIGADLDVTGGGGGILEPMFRRLELEKENIIQ